MKGVVRGRPSASMIVAGVALVAALAGTAIAAPQAVESILNKKEKKQTRNIAKQEITKAAPGLSVKNASTVGGQSPASLKSYSAFNESGTVIGSLGTSLVPVVSADITTQATTRIMATGSAELFGDDSGEIGQCEIDIDGDGSLAYEGEPDDIGTDNQFVIAVNHAVTRPPGTYSATLLCESQGGTVGKDDAAINVWAVPL
jgi:hypothetical protein